MFLLDEDGQLVKTRKFKDRQYIGDPLVALKLFNELGADEIMILSIDKISSKLKTPPWELLELLSSEALMPLSYGGGIRCADDASRIISIGYEKVIFSASRLIDGSNIKSIIHMLGSQSVTICVNYREKLFSGRSVFCHKTNAKIGKISYVMNLASTIGVGEVLLQNISREGERGGIDLDVVDEISKNFNGPIILSGGLKKLEECDQISQNISGFAAGSYFVFSGERRGVLINYPSDEERGI